MMFILIMYALFLLGIITGGLSLIEFSVFIISGKRWLNAKILGLVEAITIIIMPALFLMDDGSHSNIDNEDIATFGPGHRITMYFIILFCVIAYYSSKRNSSARGPIMEVVLNCFLLIGIVLNILIMYQIGFYRDEKEFSYFNLPIILLFIMRLAENHKLIIKQIGNRENNGNILTRCCHQVLKMGPFQKFPVLLVVCIPILFIVSTILLLFGQKPDSMVRMFTDTYYHGFSKLDPANLPFHDDHFLCTIAAKGHTGFVKPVRAGIRQGHRIMVNRQLLVSNAFEELLEQRTPRFHKFCREIYNVIGGYCTKVYHVLGNKWISDIVYVIMKPLEWIFLLVLYTFDEKPENRIAKQYLSIEDRIKLK
jgi:hypothetical protein